MQDFGAGGISFRSWSAAGAAKGTSHRWSGGTRGSHEAFVVHASACPARKSLISPDNLTSCKISEQEVFHYACGMPRERQKGRHTAGAV